MESISPVLWPRHFPTLWPSLLAMGSLQIPSCWTPLQLEWGHIGLVIWHRKNITHSTVGSNSLMCRWTDIILILLIHCYWLPTIQQRSDLGSILNFWSTSLWDPQLRCRSLTGWVLPRWFLIKSVPIEMVAVCLRVDNGGCRPLGFHWNRRMDQIGSYILSWSLHLLFLTWPLELLCSGKWTLLRPCRSLAFLIKFNMSLPIKWI